MGIRTPDPDLAKVVLYQLSYAPIVWVETKRAAELVGLSGFEPETSRLSGVCSNQLSYKPIVGSVARRRGTVCIGQATPDDPVSSQDLSSRLATDWLADRDLQREPAMIWIPAPLPA